MTDPAEPALALLEALANGPDVAMTSVEPAARRPTELSSAEMLRALVASGFDLNQAIVRLSNGR